MLVGHLHDLYAFYGYERGVRVARKHISWYTKGLSNSAVFRARMNTLDDAQAQLAAVKEFFDGLLAHSARSSTSEERGRACSLSTEAEADAARDNELSSTVRKVMRQYFKDLDGEKARGIYDMVVPRVEKPMLEVVMFQAQGNQTRAAELLGLNRNTLRKKLQQHGID